MSTPDGEPIEIDLSGAARAAESLRRARASLDTTALEGLQSRLAELSSRAADVVGAERFASRIQIPELQIPEIELPVDRAGANTERLVEIAMAQQELLGRFVADHEAAAEVEARRHRQTVVIAVLCTLGGTSLGAVLTAALT